MDWDYWNGLIPNLVLWINSLIDQLLPGLDDTQRHSKLVKRGKMRSVWLLVLPS